MQLACALADPTSSRNSISCNWIRWTQGLKGIRLARWVSIGRRGGTVSVLASLCAETDPPTAHAISQERNRSGQGSVGGIRIAGTATRLAVGVCGSGCSADACWWGGGGPALFVVLARSAGARWARRGCSCPRVRSARASSPHPTRRIAEAKPPQMGGGRGRRGARDLCGAVLGPLVSSCCSGARCTFVSTGFRFLTSTSGIASVAWRRTRAARGAAEAGGTDE